jgi:hypothetical protein
MAGVLRPPATALARRPLLGLWTAAPPAAAALRRPPRLCRHRAPAAAPWVRWAHGKAHYKDQRERRKQRPGGKPAEMYDLLGVDITATTQEIKDGFLKQVRLHHPDISPNPDAAEIFDKIKGALEVLSDIETRREYDATTCGIQPDWVYGEEEAKDVPLESMTEAELQKLATYLDERISTSNANISALGEAVINAGGVQVKRLAKELEGFMEQRKELRVELQKIAASRLKRGGNRGRKKASERLQTAGTEWWDVRVHMPCPSHLPACLPAGLPAGLLRALLLRRPRHSLPRRKVAAVKRGSAADRRRVAVSVMAQRVWAGGAR